MTGNSFGVTELPIPTAPAPSATNPPEAGTLTPPFVVVLAVGISVDSSLR